MLVHCNLNYFLLTFACLYSISSAKANISTNLYIKWIGYVNTLDTLFYSWALLVCGMLVYKLLIVDMKGIFFYFAVKSVTAQNCSTGVGIFTLAYCKLLCIVYHFIHCYTNAICCATASRCVVMQCYIFNWVLVLLHSVSMVHNLVNMLI